jgi:hypothetical protein
MLVKTLLISTIAALALVTDVAQAHSWTDCVDWRLKDGSGAKNANDFRDGKGSCFGFARRFKLGGKFASQDSADPNRHYQQPHRGDDKRMACSPGRSQGGNGEEVGSNESKPNKPQDAYGFAGRANKIGVMTKSKPGAQLCTRWPAKNHAVKDERERFVRLTFIRFEDEKKDMTQKAFASKAAFPAIKLPYKNCDSTGNQDKRACGGCYQLPKDLAPGFYTMQWRWELNDNEFYTSCSDIEVQK